MRVRVCVRPRACLCACVCARVFCVCVRVCTRGRARVGARVGARVRVRDSGTRVSPPGPDVVVTDTPLARCDVGKISEQRHQTTGPARQKCYLESILNRANV